MKYAKITNAVVSNIIEADSVFVGGQSGTWVNVTGIDCGIGWNYNGSAFSAPVVVTVAKQTQRLIDPGSFYDRFGTAKMAVLTSTDVTLKAILSDLNIRAWVDLSRMDVASALAYVGTVVPEVTTQLQTSILTTPVTAEENRVLRKLYF